MFRTTKTNYITPVNTKVEEAKMVRVQARAIVAQLRKNKDSKR